jgi:hypothetical protein
MDNESRDCPKNLSPVPIVGEKPPMFLERNLEHFIKITDKRFMFEFIGK